MIRRERAGVFWLEAEVISATGRVIHAFSTRRGGVSEGPWSELNLGHGTGDRPERVTENRRRLLAALGLAGREFVTARQVHGSHLMVVSGPREAAAVAAAPADGLLTASSAVALAILTADCLPVLLVDPRRSAVAAVHSGWRGTVQRIAGRAVRRMTEEFGSAPADLRVAIGPGIGPCCYEVDWPVLEQVAAAFPGAEDTLITPVRKGRALFDLRAAVLYDLKETGVPGENVTVVEECTACQAEWFFSYRRDGQSTGRMAAVIGLREGTGCREGKGYPEETGAGRER